MRPSVISTSQAPLLNAIELNLHEHIAFVQRSTPGMTVLGEGDLLVVDLDLSSNTFNKIARARLQESDCKSPKLIVEQRRRELTSRALIALLRGGSARFAALGPRKSIV